MGLGEINQFFKQVKTHQKNPADVIKYERWIKELKDPWRKKALDILENQNSHHLTNEEVSELYTEIKRIEPIVESDQSYEMSSFRDTGLWKSICRMFSNLFDNRTSSSVVLNAIKNLSDDTPKIDDVLSSSQKDLLDENLFELLADLPTREIELFQFTDQIPDVVGQDPITFIHAKNNRLYLGIKVLATHTPSPDCAQQDPFSFDMLIQLDGTMKIWTTSKTADNALNGFNEASFEQERKLTNQRKNVFWQHDRHDDPEMIEKGYQYDIRWLITRLSNGDSPLIRHVPEHVVWAEVTDQEGFKNYGYWNLSLNMGTP